MTTLLASLSHRHKHTKGVAKRLQRLFIAVGMLQQAVCYTTYKDFSLGFVYCLERDFLP